MDFPGRGYRMVTSAAGELDHLAAWESVYATGEL